MSEPLTHRKIIASFVTPLAVLMVPFILLMFEPGDYSDDSANIASFAISYFIIPILYVLFVIGMLLGTTVWSFIDKITLSELLALDTILSLIVGIILGIRSPFEIGDLKMFAIITIGGMICFSFGSIVWWFIVKRHLTSRSS